MKHEPRTVVIDGKEMVAVPVKQYESLLGLRRQLGAQGTRMQSLRGALSDMADFLERLEAARRQSADPPAHHTDGFAEELRHHVRHARALTERKRARGDAARRRMPSG